MNKQDTARLPSATNAVSAHNGKHVSSVDFAAKIDAAEISVLIDFFKLLDKWDRETKRQ
jgi:hypothetical protein